MYTETEILKGGQIMDNAFCGGGDSNIGLSDIKTPIQDSAIKMIKAAIFMGDPRHIPGLPYNVGTCKANGVIIPIFRGIFKLLIKYSLLLAHLASSAQSHLQSSHTATLQIHIAATEMTRTLINSMGTSTGKLHSRLSRAS